MHWREELAKELSAESSEAEVTQCDEKIPDDVPDEVESSSSDEEETSDPIASFNQSDNVSLDMQSTKKHKLSALHSQIDDEELAMSIFASAGGKHHSCHCILGKLILAPLELELPCGCFNNGVWFHKINLSPREFHVELCNVDVDVDCCAVSLPMNLDGSALHGITTSDWRTWDGDAELVSPFEFL